MLQPEAQPAIDAGGGGADAEAIADRLLAALADHPEARPKAARALAGMARA